MGGSYGSEFDSSVSESSLDPLGLSGPIAGVSWTHITTLNSQQPLNARPPPPPPLTHIYMSTPLYMPFMILQSCEKHCSKSSSISQQTEM